MRHRRKAARSRVVTSAVAAVTVVALVVLGLTASCTGGSGKTPDSSDEPQGSWAPIGPTNALIRVDQVGYATGETKVAALLAPKDAQGSSFVVEEQDGTVALRGTVGTSRGDWNSAYPDVHAIDVSRLRTAGTYRIRVTGKVSAVSPVFTVGAAKELFGQVAGDTVKFFQVQRDGTDQVSDTLPRVASHQNDAHATVYDQPDFSNGDDLAAGLSPATDATLTVDAEGGWFDAGDYLKFTHTTAYALTLMLLAQRGGTTTIGNGKDIEGLADETAFGLSWLDKMWDSESNTLYLQVGLGSGGTENLVGDHDGWRLPQADDTATGDSKRFLRNRPVFRANSPGGEISPNVAGRVAAAFALAAQVEAGSKPAKARAHLAAAASILALAHTEDPGTLVTALPRAYYAESSWTDDMALGTTELARAALVLGDTRATSWIGQAAHWAKLAIADGNRQPLNLYDVEPLADTELAGLFQEASNPTGEVDQATLAGDLKARLQAGVTAADNSPIGAAAPLTTSDFTSKTFGWSAVASLYQRMSGDDSFAAFGTEQRNVALGTNGWGLSLVVGVGATFPHCIHHQIANLAGNLNGTGHIAVGAVVNGPNATAAFASLTPSSDASKCTGVNVSRFDRSTSRFLDQPYAYSSTEPAIDYTATALLSLTLAARQ